MRVINELHTARSTTEFSEYILLLKKFLIFFPKNFPGPVRTPQKVVHQGFKGVQGLTERLGSFTQELWLGFLCLFLFFFSPFFSDENRVSQQ